MRLNILTRKTLGGLQTDLDSRVLGADGQPVPGLYAAGEVAGFGGGGVHGYAALEGTFLGGCIFSGRARGGRRRGAWLKLRHPSAIPVALSEPSAARAGPPHQRRSPPTRRLEPGRPTRRPHRE